MQTDWEKRAQELLNAERDSFKSVDQLMYGPPEVRAAIQLGREMAAERAVESALRLAAMADSIEEQKRKAADARAEEIARLLEARPYANCDSARIARATIKKPKTREQVLEEALREIVNRAGPYEAWSESPSEIAERALDWKPPS